MDNVLVEGGHIRHDFITGDGDTKPKRTVIGSFLEAGYIYAPYIPIQSTTTIHDPNDFQPTEDMVTRYTNNKLYPMNTIEGLTFDNLGND